MGTLRADEFRRAVPASAARRRQRTLESFWRATLGDGEGAADAKRYLDKSLAEGTVKNYTRLWHLFATFCERNGLVALPASTDTVLRYLGWIGRGDRWAASSLQQLCSAINRMHMDLDMEPPARGHAVKALRKGIAYAQAEAGRGGPPRTWMRLEHMLQILRTAERTDDVRVLRACAAVLLAICLFARASTASAIQRADLVMRDGAVGGFDLIERFRKGQQHKPQRRVLSVPAGAFPRVQAVLRRFVKLRGAPPGGKRGTFFALRGETQKASDPQMLLKFVLAHCGIAPPAGTTYSWHSLRKGAATLAYAGLQVQLGRMCYWAGWSVRSQTVWDYVDLSCPPSPGADVFFGWLVR